MKLYAVVAGPPSMSTRLTLKALNIPYEMVWIDYNVGEHLTEEYVKMNPQMEIPVLEDDGFYLSESIAIQQYLCDKYAKNTSLYPADPKQRAIINHRLCFNGMYYYSGISSYVFAPIFYEMERTPYALKRLHMSLKVFETYIKQLGTKYAAGDNVTIADFALVCATACLEGISIDWNEYPLINKWYKTFQTENAELWSILKEDIKEIINFETNPPDLSKLDHPVYPIRKTKRAEI